MIVVDERKQYRIGDVEPLPDGVDVRLARVAMSMRGHLARLASRKTNNERTSRARLIVNGMAEAEQRLADPVEQAKTFLRRKGFKPVAQIAARDWQAGRHHFASEAELLAFAESKGWKR